MSRTACQSEEHGLTPSPSAYAPPAKPRTLDMRVTGHPLDPHHVGTFIKPSELVGAVEISSLNAWNATEPGKVYRIRKADLRTSHGSNDRLHEAFHRLMSGFARVKYRDPVSGKAMTMRIHLLGPNTEEDADSGYFYYTFHDTLLKILEKSQTWARLKACATRNIGYSRQTPRQAAAIGG